MEGEPLDAVDDYDPEEEEYELTFTDKKGNKKDWEQHQFLEDHYDEEGYANCDCKSERIKKSVKEIIQIKNKWRRENYEWVEGDKESIKIVLDISKQLAAMWGINISTSMPTIFDQRKQTIQLKGENHE